MWKNCWRLPHYQIWLICLSDTVLTELLLLNCRKIHLQTTRLVDSWWWGVSVVAGFDHTTSRIPCKFGRTQWTALSEFGWRRFDPSSASTRTMIRLGWSLRLGLRWFQRTGRYNARATCCRSNGLVALLLRCSCQNSNWDSFWLTTTTKQHVLECSTANDKQKREIHWIYFFCLLVYFSFQFFSFLLLPLFI